MKQKLAFVLGGGGARGAMQVGAIRALLEAGYRPDALVGTSIGAANAVFLALSGCDVTGIDALEKAWFDAQRADLFPSNYLWLTVRALFNRPAPDPTNRLRDFFIAHGVTPELTFKDITCVELGLVSTDLNSGKPVIHGLESADSVLEGVLASTALPPWVKPMTQDEKMLMDGGAVSNLPIEPALALGVTEIIAMDLSDPGDILYDAQGFGPFVQKLIHTVQQRQLELELAVANACGVKVRYLHLMGTMPVPLWDFRSTEELIGCGYTIAQRSIAGWEPQRRSLLQKILG